MGGVARGLDSRRPGLEGQVNGTVFVWPQTPSPSSHMPPSLSHLSERARACVCVCVCVLCCVLVCACSCSCVSLCPRGV